MQRISRTGRINVAIALLIIAVIAAAVFVSYLQGTATAARGDLAQWEPGGKKFPVKIRKPGLMPMVDSGKVDRDGNAVMVRCNNCHDSKKPNPATSDADELKDFHQRMTFKHNSLKCVSCHDTRDYESLHLADGSTVSFSHVMQLCAQCHGPQFRDYRNGSHGGMTGYWDLSRGPRERNNCIDCHDPHAPAYPMVMPVFQPKTHVGSVKGGGKAATGH